MERRATWPDRPMENSERRAVWAAKYYLKIGAVPNTYPWKWTAKKKVQTPSEDKP